MLVTRGFSGGSDRKLSTYSAGDPGSIRGLRRSPWRREWQPTSVFFPGEFHRQRSLEGTVHGVSESDRTEQLTFSLPGDEVWGIGERL